LAQGHCNFTELTLRYLANLAAPLLLKRDANGSQVDQSFARKAQQEPEGEMEETETAAAAEALAHRSRSARLAAVVVWAKIGGSSQH
jgi:hypothetical protein